MDKPFPGDRRRDTSSELTEVRTIHSRAKTALKTVQGMPARVARWPQYYKVDPDSEDMAEALRQVIKLLERWSR